MNLPSTPDSALKQGFQPTLQHIPLQAIQATKPLGRTVKSSQKYRQITASVRAIGLVEPPVVIPDPQRSGHYYLLDGALRIEACKDIGVQEIDCLVAIDDEAYTYNKHVNRLSAVQGHRMIRRAIERGVPAEAIASALNLSAKTIQGRFRLLDGLCKEAIALLADKEHCPKIIFDTLRKMKPVRQIEAAELIVGQNDYSGRFVLALLEATPDSQWIGPRREPAKESSREQIQRLERELARVQNEVKYRAERYGDDHLQLTIAQRHLSKLLEKGRIVRWLRKHHADYLDEFQAIVEAAAPMETGKSRAPVQ